MHTTLLRLATLSLLCATGLGCQGEDAGDDVGAPEPGTALHAYPLGEGFELNVGEIAQITPIGYRVHFDAIRNDSRCPEGVQCAWAGDAEVLLSVTRPDVADTLRLVINAGIPAEAHPIGGGYSLRLIQLRPPARAQEEIPIDEYVVRLIVTPVDPVRTP